VQKKKEECLKKGKKQKDSNRDKDRLGYIEFDDLCNLDCLEERVCAHADLP
jgi:hypothetical protein